MSLSIQCRKCGKGYRVGDDKAGMKLKCKACGAVIAIPGGDSWDNETPAALPPRVLQKTGPRKKRVQPAHSSSATLWIAGSVAGVAVIGLIVVVILLASRGGDQTKQEVASATDDRGNDGSLGILGQVIGLRDRARKLNQAKKMRAISNAIYKLANANENKIYPNVGSNGLPARMDGRKVGLSWRVYILPFLGEQKLYAAFNHNEPWDGPNNKKLIERMPDVFRAPDVTGTGKTSIHVFVSKPGNYRLPRLSGRHPSPFREFEKGDKQARGRRARDIRDGFYNTLMFVKAGPDKADIWTKPTGIPFDSHENPLESLGTIPREGFWVAFFDGVVGQIKPTISLDLLKKLIQYDDFTTPERIRAGASKYGRK